MKNEKRSRGDFSGISKKFSKNIYDSTKGRLRMAVLKEDLQPLLNGEPCRVLDVGAGLGQANEWFLEKGFEVLHTDISEEMVEAARLRHEELGLADNCRYQTADLATLASNEGQFPIVLCHAVLEWMPDAETALTQLKTLLAPGGTLSLMFYNRNAKLFANAIYGNFDYIERGLKVKKTVRLSPQNPLVPDDVQNILNELGLEVVQKTGVRCFHDYLRNLDDQQRFDELLAIELKYNQQPPYRDLGRYQHWLIKKPENEQ